MAGRRAIRNVVGVDATRHFPPGHLRVSDADRDRALAELSEHYQAGRLTTEEMEERTAKALASKTGSDLTGLFADLPPTGIAAPKAPAPRQSRAGWAMASTAGLLIVTGIEKTSKLLFCSGEA